jgi:hypothetical protein
MIKIFKPNITQKVYNDLVSIHTDIRNYAEPLFNFPVIGTVVFDRDWIGWVAHTVSQSADNTISVDGKESEILLLEKVFTAIPDLKDRMDQYKLDFPLGYGPFFAWPPHRHVSMMPQYLLGIPIDAYDIPVSLHRYEESDLFKFHISNEEIDKSIVEISFTLTKEDKCFIMPSGYDLYHGTDPSKTPFERFKTARVNVFQLKNVQTEEQAEEYYKWISTM